MSEEPRVREDDDGLWITKEQRLTDQRGAAVDMLSRRALKARTDEKGPVGDERAWLAQARQRVAEKHGERMRAIVALEPGIEATSLADRLEPVVQPDGPRPGPLDEMQQAQRRAMALHDNYRANPDGPVTPRDVAKTRLAELRQLARGR